MTHLAERGWCTTTWNTVRNAMSFMFYCEIINKNVLYIFKTSFIEGFVWKKTLFFLRILCCTRLQACRTDSEECFWDGKQPFWPQATSASRRRSCVFTSSDLRMPSVKHPNSINSVQRSLTSLWDLSSSSLWALDESLITLECVYCGEEVQVE